MSFVRTVKKDSPFVQLDKEYIGNGKLSLKATGLLTYFLSKPDGWQIRMADVKNRFNDKDTSIRTGIKELIECGYINRDRERKQDGTFGDWIYEVYERPEYNIKFVNGEPKRDFQIQVSPKCDFPRQENPRQENQSYSNNDLSNNDLSNKEEEEEGLNNLVSFFSKNITPSGSEVVKKKLSEWLLKLPYIVIMAELETCSLYGAKTWNYIEKALKDDLKRNIATLEQLEAKYREYNEKKQESQKKKTVVNKGGKVLPIRKEILPDWFQEQEKVEEVLPQQTQEEFLKRKAEVMERIKKLRAK